MNLVRSRATLALILLLYLLLAALFAVYTPRWQAPDEPAHYNYVRYLATNGSFPVLHMGDYPHVYLEQIKAAKFPAAMSIDPIRYEFHQPPLYYALLAPVFALTHGSLTALRLVSALLGAGIVLLTYAVGRWVFPARQPGLALGAAAFVAFLPQHLATVSQVGNDVLAELLLAAVLFVLIQRIADRGVRNARAGAGHRQKSAVILGILLGLILVTKTTAYIAAPLAIGVFVWCWWREGASLRCIVGESLAVILPAALIALPWYARNISVYGWPDFLGLQRHDAIVAGQLRTADYIDQAGRAAYWRRAVEWTFKSFVGVFGWMGVWLDSRIYLALALLGGTVVGGHLVRPTHPISRIPHPEKITDSANDPQSTAPALTRQRSAGASAHNLQSTIHSPQSAIRMLACSALLTFLVYAWYNTQFVQFQGRYLFTALIPIALAFAAGWDRVVRPGAGRWVAAGLFVLAAGLVAWGWRSGEGLPEWPVAIVMAAAIGALLLDLGLTLLARLRGRGAADRAFSLLRLAASAFPYAFLALSALYALFGAILSQLT